MAIFYRTLLNDADRQILASEIQLDNSFRLLQIYNRAKLPRDYSYLDGDNLSEIRKTLMQTLRHTDIDNLTLTDKEELGIVAVLMIGEVAELNKGRNWLSPSFKDLCQTLALCIASQRYYTSSFGVIERPSVA